MCSDWSLAWRSERRHATKIRSLRPSPDTFVLQSQILYTWFQPCDLLVFELSAFPVSCSTSRCDSSCFDRTLSDSCASTLGPFSAIRAHGRVRDASEVRAFEKQSEISVNRLEGCVFCVRNGPELSTRQQEQAQPSALEYFSRTKSDTPGKQQSGARGSRVLWRYV